MGYYLEGKRHKFLNLNECLIFAEKKYERFGFKYKTKKIIFKCKIPNNYNNYNIHFDFYYNDKKVKIGSYDHFQLILYSNNILNDLKQKSNILKQLRKDKLKWINEM